MLMFGPLADYIDVGWLLIGTGILTIGQGFIMSRNKVLVEAGKPE